jgi:ribonuclease D
MHAAANDISLLQREYGFTIRQVFDTQLAARILGWKQAGLAAILEEHFGVVSNKRMQRANAR